MFGARRWWWCAAWLVLPVIGCCVAISLAPSEADAQGATRLTAPDATLRDVCFVDETHGWAVGDRGTIWHTQNGGRQWVLQHTRAEITLYDVHFLDRLHGWAVGGLVQPVTWRSIGVVLKTTNGGRRWTVIPSAGLPELRHIRFFTPDEGVASGATSPMFLGGIFRSRDGGRSWEGIAGRKRRNWRAAAWRSPDEGLVLHDDRAALFRGGRLGPDNPIARGAALRAVIVAGDQSWLAVGDRATLLQADRSGNTWTSLSERLPAPFRDGPDFHAAASIGNDRWIVGSPGSFVLHSSDAGTTWEVFHTNQTLPLHAVTFVDRTHGWAVGALGTILATSDGGRHWELQHQRADRVAWWSMTIGDEQVPLPLIAQYGAQEGWIGGSTHIVTGAGADPVVGVSEETARRRSAAMLVGAGFFESIEEPQAGAATLPGVGSKAAPGPTAAQETALRRRVGWLLAQWRPDVVIMSDWYGPSNSMTSRMLYRAVIESFQPAGLETRFSKQLRAWGLEPWQPVKIVRVADARRTLTRTIPMTQFMPGLSRTIENQTWEALLFLDRTPKPFRKSFGWRLIRARDRRAANDRELFDDRRWPPGSELRRTAPRLPWRLQRLNEVVQSIRALDAVLDEPQSLVVDPNWFGRFQQLAAPLPAVDAGNYLYRIALAAAEAGYWHEAFAAMRVFLQQYEAHPLSEGALSWLIRHRGSREIARAAVGASKRPEPTDQAVLDAMQTWLERLTARSLTYATDPRVMLPMSAALRRADQPDRQHAMLQPVARRDVAGRFAALAQAEIWLVDHRGALTVPRYQAARMLAPTLDGKLDDPPWQTMEPLVLKPARRHGANLGPPTEVWFGWDAEYLYLACRCPKRPGRRQAVTERTRRDAASTDLDHIRIELDIDRDYHTAFELVIDSRGQVADRAAGSAAWEPTWHVAVRETAAAWQVEAAMPLEELTVCPDQETSELRWGLRVWRGVANQCDGQWPAAGAAPWGWLERVRPPRTSRRP